MSLIPAEGQMKLEQLIVKHIPRDVFMALEDAYFDGDLKGRGHGATYAKGHRRSAAGHAKHFLANEAFYVALEVHGAQPTPLRGNDVVIGRLGIFNIARLNVPGHKWVSLRRSKTRTKLAEINTNIARAYVQSDLFTEVDAVSNGTIFILGVMDGVDSNGLTQLTQVMVAMPAPDMRSWLYLVSLTEFLKLYDAPESAVQPDNAKPVLRDVRKKRQADDDQGNN